MILAGACPETSGPIERTAEAPGCGTLVLEVELTWGSACEDDGEEGCSIDPVVMVRARCGVIGALESLVTGACGARIEPEPRTLAGLPTTMGGCT